jgi:hypothetical protein
MARGGAPVAPGSRRSRLRDRTDGADFDNRDGFWSRSRLVAMDRAYCEAVARHYCSTAPASEEKA